MAKESVKKIFPSSSINTENHWMVGTEWQFSKGKVTMYDKGFHCDCKKNPNKACNHIKNVKMRILGVFS